MVTKFEKFLGGSANVVAGFSIFHVFPSSFLSRLAMAGPTGGTLCDGPKVCIMIACTVCCLRCANAFLWCFVESSLLSLPLSLLLTRNRGWYRWFRGIYDVIYACVAHGLSI